MDNDRIATLGSALMQDLEEMERNGYPFDATLLTLPTF